MNNPNVLFHYTCADGLLGMIQNGTLWLSQIQYMNDSHEYHHTFDIAKQRLGHYACVGESCKRALSAKLFDYFSSSKTMSRTYVFALSEKPDLLSQWRGYAKDGGYCIGFDFKELNSLASKNGLKLVKCVYKIEEKTAIIDDCIMSIIAMVKVWPMPDDHYSAILTKLVNELRVFAEYFKHESFEEEVEWRLVGLVSAHDKRGKWRTKDNSIVPYCELELNVKDIIKEIIIGPKLDKELSFHALQFLFMNLGYKIPIKNSSSPLV